MAAFKSGGTDANGNRIVKIFARGDEYVIYEIKSKDLVETVKIYIENTTENDDSGIIKRYNLIRIKFVEIKGLLYKVIDKSTIKTVISQILAHGITEKPDEANTQFDTLKIQINRDYSEQFTNRLKLLFSSLFLSLLIITLAALTYYYKWFSAHNYIKDLIFVSAAGSIGGFFSLSVGLKKIVCEKEVSSFLYVVYGLERIIISIFASTIIYFAIKAELIFGTYNKAANPLVGYIVLSFLAGFSETLVPNLMKKIEKE